MGPLNGIKILGFTHFAQGPFALQLLGDLGADIINIERPNIGDFNRKMLNDDAINGESPYFLGMNRNKRSLTLDLKRTESIDIIKKLIARSDVLVSNYRAGVLDKLGLGFEEVKKINDTIIYAEAIGYGSTGPYAKLPGQDLLAQSISGYTSIVGSGEVPSSGGTFLVDMYSSAMLACGISAALVNKQNGGKAQKLEVNLLNSALHLQSQEITYYLNTGKKPQKAANHSGHVHMEAPYGIYKTKNGYMSISSTAPEKIGLLGEILEIENLEEMMPNKTVMLRDREKIYEVISAALLKQDTEYWLSQMQPQGFWCAKINDYEGMENDPQIAHNQIIQHINHPIAGDIKVIGSPIKFSETPAEIRRRPPLLGEHNAEILAELGYTVEQIEQYKKDGLF